MTFHFRGDMTPLTALLSVLLHCPLLHGQHRLCGPEPVFVRLHRPHSINKASHPSRQFICYPKYHPVVESKGERALALPPPFPPFNREH
ncbi:hypothetical protein HDK90DRAFT_253317 [Phyllosticta capitalensis]|uniref:Secreted protein n=1 Tax=Phyllosticta capitalensis TaxID=121624 RepID=A0ABR1YR21_9PEZI